jgi:hypothetical protein
MAPSPRTNNNSRKLFPNRQNDIQTKSIPEFKKRKVFCIHEQT